MEVICPFPLPNVMRRDEMRCNLMNCRGREQGGRRRRREKADHASLPRRMTFLNNANCPTETGSRMREDPTPTHTRSIVQRESAGNVLPSSLCEYDCQLSSLYMYNMIPWIIVPFNERRLLCWQRGFAVSLVSSFKGAVAGHIVLAGILPWTLFVHVDQYVEHQKTLSRVPSCKSAR